MTIPTKTTPMNPETDVDRFEGYEMTTKLEHAALQALEALEKTMKLFKTMTADECPDDPYISVEEAITSLREALEQPDVVLDLDQETLEKVRAGLANAVKVPVSQEPVDGVLPCPFCGCADISVNEGSTFRWRYAMCDNCGAQAGEVRFDTLAPHTAAAEKQAHKEAIEEWNSRAAPVRTKDLTDDEIAEAVGSPLDEVYLADFRDVIAADREKNK